ncbi:hypothetical protein [Aeromonas rivipollensis]|uniref:hypothetical protein n=1 Tax=Aeromonas rivipollensis TaxID=948519 RepID=UPI003D1CF475
MQNRENIERSLIPVMVLTGLVASPIIFIAGIIFGAEFSASVTLTADSLSSWVGAIATVSIAVLTFILAKETWHLRNAQISQLNEIRRESMRPNVIVNIQPSIVSISFWDVVIQNLGKGIAKNVSFEFQNHDGTIATKDNNHLIDIFNKLSLFGNGCSSLGLGQSIKSFLLNFHELENAVGSDNIFKQKVRLVIKFEDVEGYIYSNTIDIDFSDFKGISVLGDSTDPVYSIYKELEKIRKTLEPTFKSGFRKLKVDIYNSSDRDNERKIYQEKYVSEQEQI